MGYGGQAGQYTDIETLNVAAGTYLSSMGGNGIYWDPQTGRWLVRGGDGVNGYDTTNPIRHDDGLFSGRNLSVTAAGVAGGLLGGLPGAAIAVGIDEVLLSRVEGSTAVNALERGAAAAARDYALGKAFEVSGGLVARSAFGQAVAAKVKSRFPNCFVAGTLVAMADGSFEKIEDVREGDLVLSRNPETGVTKAKAVLARSVKIAPQVLTLTLTDATTHLTQTLTCTPEHPFYVQGRGFVAAGSLGIGTSIVTRAGPCLAVSGITYEPKSTGGVLVYNLKVEGDHSYFAGTVDGGAWVHNASYAPLSEFDIDEYRNFNVRARRGDGLEGHEVLQNAWLEANGHISSRGTGTLSLGNPALALGRNNHKWVGIVQTEMGLGPNSGPYLRTLTSSQIIDLNVTVMRRANMRGANIPESAIQAIGIRARAYAALHGL